MAPCSQRAQAVSRPRSAERSEGSLDTGEHDGKVGDNRTSADDDKRAAPLSSLVSPEEILRMKNQAIRRCRFILKYGVNYSDDEYLVQYLCDEERDAFLSDRQMKDYQYLAGPTKFYSARKEILFGCQQSMVFGNCRGYRIVDEEGRVLQEGINLGFKEETVNQDEDFGW